MGSFSSKTKLLHEQKGCMAAFTNKALRITHESNLLRLFRISIESFDAIITFQRKLIGDYDIIGNAKSPSCYE